jgi:hypothetical protein
MEASQVNQYLLLSSLELQLIFKLAQFGKLRVLVPPAWSHVADKSTSPSIYKPTKPASQSGTWHGPAWRMDWDPLPKGHRWENPLIGWQSTADFMQGERLGFSSKEDAIRFAEKQGYEYFVQEPNVRKFVPKAYANNFVHIPTKLKVIRTK